MTVTCPEGHRSEATDYCDTCGTPIAAGAAGAASGTGAGGGDLSSGGSTGGWSGAGGPASVLDLDPPQPAATVTCPHCGGVNVADALFCEACGYDFTTGAPPLGDDPAPAPAEEPDEEPTPEEQPVPEGDPTSEEEAKPEPEATPDREPSDEVPESTPEVGDPDPEDAQDDTDEPEQEAHLDPDGPEDEAEPVADGPEAADVPDAADEAAADAQGQPGEEEGAAGDAVDEQPEPEPAAPAPPRQAPQPPAPAGQAHARPRHTPPSRALSSTWVVEVWIDPDWYAVQQTAEACPSPGVPDIVLVRRNVVLVGRPSGSLGARPDVDAGSDSAVSRRHAQLTSDGRRWWIEDLGSSNGTYLGAVGEPLPTESITPGVRVEIDRDDRIYIGAWTRLVIRQATASEEAGEG